MRILEVLGGFGTSGGILHDEHVRGIASSQTISCVAAFLFRQEELGLI
jgi:hypothetical protein